MEGERESVEENDRPHSSQTSQLAIYYNIIIMGAFNTNMCKIGGTDIDETEEYKYLEVTSKMMSEWWF